MIKALHDRLRNRLARSSFFRFLVSGGVNTIVTYAIYLALVETAGYGIAYTTSYVCGIVLAFLINRVFVFKEHQGWRSMILFPFVYLAQYLASLFILWIWIERLQQSEATGPILAIIITVPLTFILSKLVFVGRASGK